MDAPDARPREEDRARARRVVLPRSRGDLDVRIFSSPSGADRARRPTDILFLILSVGALVLFSFLEHAGVGQGGPLASAIRSVPGLFGWFWEVSNDLLVIWPAVLIVAAVLGRHRLRLLRDQMLAAGLALLAAGLTGWAATGSWPVTWHALWGTEPPITYPAMRLALAGAVIVASSPHLGRPLRYTGRLVLWMGAIAAVAVMATEPIGAAAAIAVALGAAAAVHLVFGSPGGRPTTHQVAKALESLGVDAHDLHAADLQPHGVAVVRATSEDGDALLVKVYGRDAWDGQLLTSLWSSIWYRDDAPRFTLNRLQQVEHEAFVTLLAERVGVSVLPLVAAGMAGDEDALVVINERGRPLDALESDAEIDPFLDTVWNAVTGLHGAGFTHGRLDAQHLFVLPEGTAALGDLSDASAGASEQDVAADRAQLLVTTALSFGVEPAVRAAASALGTDGLAQVLPLVQEAALTSSTRKTLKRSDADLDALRQAAAGAAGVELPKLQHLRRVSLGSVAMVALILVASYVIISAITGLGVDNIADEFKTAEGGWFWAAFLLAPLVPVADAVVTLGATTKALRFGPVIALQLAIRFVSLAVPTTAGRVAMTIRFFQKSGVPAASAVTVGALDGFSGFVVQVVILLVLSFSGVASLSQLTAQRSGGGSLGWVVIVVALVLVATAVVVVLVVKRLREWVRARLREARAPLAVLRSPSKVAMLMLGNLAAQLISAIVLSMSLRAFGESAPLGVLLFVNTAVSMFAGFMPVPGGIGVYEGALTASLVAFGIPEAAALATALTYRAVTYYLPPIYGGVAMRWLTRHGYL